MMEVVRGAGHVIVGVIVTVTEIVLGVQTDCVPIVDETEEVLEL